MATPFAGAVLTGGASRRMGSDKALIRLGGRRLADVALDALGGAGAASLAAVGGVGAQLERPGVTFVADHQAGEGPLSGILSALAWSPAPWLVVLSCDLPNITRHEVAAVLGALDAHPHAAVAAPRLGMVSEFLAAAYRVEAAMGHLADAYRAGERAVRRAAEGLVVLDVHGLDPARLSDVDCPAELARLGVSLRPDGHG